MDALKIWQFFGISLIPFAVAVLLHLLFKFTNPLSVSKPTYVLPEKHKFFYKFFKYPIHKFLYIIFTTKKGAYWWRQFWIGLVFITLAIVGYYFGIKIEVTNPNLIKLIGANYFVVGNSTVSPIIAGLIFGWPAGIFSGVVASIFRVCMGGWLAWPTAIALFLSGAIAGSVSRFIFEDKLPPWHFSFLTAIFVETLNIALIYIFNTGNVSDTYTLVRQFDIECIGFAATSTALSSLIIALVEKKTVLPKKKNIKSVSFNVQILLFITCFLGMSIMTFSVEAASRLKNEEDYSQVAVQSVEDVHKTIEVIAGGTADPVAILNALKVVPHTHHVSTQGFVITVAARDLVIKDEQEQIIATYKKDEIIAYPESIHPKEKEKFYYYVKGKKYSLEDDISQPNKITYCTIFNRVYLMTYDTDKDWFGSPYAHTVVLIPYDEVDAESGTVFRIALYTNLLASIAIFTITEYFVLRKIVHRIEVMDTGLEEIMGGNLDKEIHIEGYNEFTNLSDNINLTVGALKNYAHEVEMRIENDLLFARNIQTTSVPTAFPFEKNYNIYAKMEPAKEVGGDFYDYYKMNNGRVLFLIADVSGKGIPAAMFMMRAQTLIRSLSSTDIPLEDIANMANRELCTQNESALFVTAWIGILDPNNGELRYVNCGHMNPLLKRKGQKFEEFKGTNHNFVLAASPDYKYKTEITYLEPGDEIILYTDGVTEAQNRQQQLYGTQRLLDFVNNAKYFNAKQLLDEISDDVVKYAEGLEPFDDTTLLIMRYLGNADIIPETAITLKARPTNAPIAVNFVESILMKYELPLTFVARVSIVVDELFANIAFYAYPEDHVGEATIQVDFRDECFYLTMIDSGVPFDPTLPRKVDTSSSIDKRKRGGLGIFIVKKTMDELKYEYRDNKNILNLVKHLKNIPKTPNDEKKTDAKENVDTNKSAAPKEASPKVEKKINTDPDAIEAALANLPDDE